MCTLVVAAARSGIDAGVFSMINARTGLSPVFLFIAPTSAYAGPGGTRQRLHNVIGRHAGQKGYSHIRPFARAEEAAEPALVACMSFSPLSLAGTE